LPFIATLELTDNVRMRILLAEDEHALGEWLCKALAQSGHNVDWRDNGRLTELALVDHDYDVLVLDMGLPMLSGQEVLHRLRAQDKRLPVLVLTARDSLSNRVSMLNEGADDFLAKPFELAELEARLTALVRRARGNEYPRFTCGSLQFDTVTRQFTLGSATLQLSPREHAMLKVLIQRSGEPVSRQHIMDRIFKDDEDIQSSAVDVLMYRLRRRLEFSGVSIKTYRGLGYALELDSPR
jgi:two-component system, OmpR family, response regulator TctD